jgi:hypothetical protein
MRVVQALAGVVVGALLGLVAAWGAAQALTVPPPPPCPEHPVLEARIADLEARLAR